MGMTGKWNYVDEAKTPEKVEGKGLHKVDEDQKP
jgi:hypothetical protein